ncbi:MAG TPA: LON peptidase substrate-binding domain-containing protein, partial [Taishania sp.]|nr:LON peptidase substrate-binding domain-containing protein [Taishania sp.]
MNDQLKDALKQLTDIIDSETEFIPLITSDEEETMNNTSYPDILPILPLRNNVLFPGVVIPITVGRDKSIKLIQAANKGDKIVGVVSQKDQEDESPEFDDLHKIGTVAQIIRLLKMPDGSSTAIIQGKRRFELVEPIQSEPFIKARVQYLEEPKVDYTSKEMTFLIDSVKESALQIIKESPNIPSEASFALKNIDSPSFLINFVSSNMNADVAKKQSILDELDAKKRLMLVLEQLNLEVQMLQMRNEIQSKVKKDIDRQQREYFLHQQIRTIQDELGGSPHEMDVQELQERALRKKWDEKTEKVFYKELEKLKRTNPQGAEYTVLLNYLDLLLDLPWGVYTKDIHDLKRASKVLERDHY